MNIMNFTKTILHNLFMRPVTRPYPATPRIYQDRTRGHIRIDIETCIFCSLCEKKCPVSVITVKRDEKSWEIERLGCIQCGACVEVCPVKCLYMMQTYTQPDAQKPFDKFYQQKIKEKK
ncbi:MAG: 4Fe-4S dicluster domain-containing protein [Saccharofermentanales bacterium]